MTDKITLVAKTKTESFGILGTAWEWVKYDSPNHFEYIGEEKAQYLIMKLGLVEVARNHTAILYDTQDGAFLNKFKGFFARKKIMESAIAEAQALAKIKNRI